MRTGMDSSGRRSERFALSSTRSSTFRSTALPLLATVFSRTALPLLVTVFSRAALPLLVTVAVATFGALPGCSSGGTKSAEASAKTGRPVELRYRAVAKNLSFGIVNESHTDRTELYSSRQPLDKATIKVSPDEVVDAIVEYFRDEGFFDIAQSGSAPKTAPAGASQILEVSLPEGPYFAVMQPGVSTDFVTKFQTCSKALLDVYNSTMQLQAVDSTPDWSGGGQPSSRPRNASKSGG